MKKRLVCLLVTLCLGVGLVGCGSQEKNVSKDDTNNATATADATTKETVTIQFMHSLVEEDRQAVIEGILEEFEAANPGIDVQQMPVPEDTYETKITALGGSGQLPAIMELSQDFAKINAKNQFIDFEAVNQVVGSKGEDNFFEGALDVIKTEDGQNFTGVPINGWIQGIWYSKKAFAEKGIEEPKTWDDVLAAAKTFDDKANKKFGIAIPTIDGVFTEQVFSQFALSNNANVLDKDGNATFNTPEMKEAIKYYKDLAQYTMPGSNDVPEVKDAFMNGSAPMALYSTYILPSAYSVDMIDDIGFIIPSNKQEAAYGNISLVSISSDLESAEREAAIKFASYLMDDTVNTKWMHMAPGGAQPLIKTVATSDAYLSNEVVQSFSGISDKITGAYDNLQMFGSVEGKNFLVMGDITSKGIIGKAINDVVVQNKDIDEVAENAQKEIEKLLN